jgi:pimeloyl-ACP methyl ester carboxylesterase
MSQTTLGSKRTFRKRLGRLLLFCVGLYLLVCAGCATFQRRLIYFPPVYTSERVDEFAQSTKLERWKNTFGQAIGMKRPSPKQPAEGRVLIVYGNGSCATGCAHYANDIQSVAAFDVFILEYPGYEDRSGSPSQRSLFRAADEAFQLLPTNGPAYLVGESLGTGVAAYLAGKYPDKIAGVVLLAPYNRLTDVAQEHMPLLPVHLMLVDRFPSEDYLRNYHGPVAMLVAGEDQVIPEKFGRRLYDGYAGPKRLWEFPDGNHGTVMVQPPEVWEQIITFLQTNPSPARAAQTNEPAQPPH